MAWYEIHTNGERWSLAVHNTEVEPDRVTGQGAELLARMLIANAFGAPCQPLVDAVLPRVVTLWDQAWTTTDAELARMADAVATYEPAWS